MNVFTIMCSIILKKNEYVFILMQFLNNEMAQVGQ